MRAVPVAVTRPAAVPVEARMLAAQAEPSAAEVAAHMPEVAAEPVSVEPLLAAEAELAGSSLCFLLVLHLEICTSRTALEAVHGQLVGNWLPIARAMIQACSSLFRTLGNNPAGLHLVQLRVSQFPRHHILRLAKGSRSRIQEIVHQEIAQLSSTVLIMIVRMPRA